jgi:uncharacterized protein (TIGR00251 family)
MNAITQTKDGILLNIEVSPRSDKFEISGYNDWREAVEVRIKAHPQKGRANKEIVNEFSKITKTHVEIISGHKSHHKILKIYGKSETDMIKILNLILNHK